MRRRFHIDKWFIASIICLFLILHETPLAQGQEPSLYGPGNGTLVIVGGGQIGQEIHDAFALYAGGCDARIIIIPTAGEPDRIDTSKVRERWTGFGYKNVSVLHITDALIAGTDSVVNLIMNARAIWFEGGRQWRLVDVYGGTLAEKAFHEVLKRGGVIGGTSAGATIQGSFLVRGDVSGNTIMISPNEKHQRGFGFLKNSAIDQHIDARNRWNDLTEVIEKFPELLGIGISESTAIVVQGDNFRVIGPGKVAITTNKSIQSNESTPQILTAGDWYDIKKREVRNH